MKWYLAALGPPVGVVVSQYVLSCLPKPCSMTIVGNGPVPVAGSVTSTSIGVPSKLGTRAASFAVGQNRTPFCGTHACPNGALDTAEAAAGRASSTPVTSRAGMTRFIRSAP